MVVKDKSRCTNRELSVLDQGTPSTCVSIFYTRAQLKHAYQWLKKIISRQTKLYVCSRLIINQTFIPKNSQRIYNEFTHIIAPILQYCFLNIQQTRSANWCSLLNQSTTSTATPRPWPKPNIHLQLKLHHVSRSIVTFIVNGTSQIILNFVRKIY